eukprot:c13471_g1_i2.p1 GENE.c13471_g1_i2~~c13471_g1_i2.p1  ORF type:complete len:123 (+),score=26.97 c13471_g1_i2:2-370(+)
MSCPVGAQGKSDVSTKVILTEFEGLLTNCSDQLTALNDCTQKVVRNQSGSCLTESHAYTTCLGARNQQVKKIVGACSANGQSPMQAHTECLQKHDQSMCLVRLHNYFLCAQSNSDKIQNKFS